MDSSNDKLVRDIEGELHDLCQPLTALHFRLEAGKSTSDLEALQEAIDGALEETARMIEAIKRMRERVARIKAAARLQSSSGELRSAAEITDRPVRR